MRILALDWGKRRIGLAISDELGITAQGLPTLERANMRSDLAKLARLTRQNSVGLILLGDPIHLSGQVGPQAESAREFARALARQTGLEVRLWDERLTSRQASRVLQQSGVSIEKRARAVDRLSAVILLQSYLDSLAPAARPISSDGGVL